MRWRRKSKKRRDLEIAPDEIFLDDTNSAEFDRARFEGRMERPLARSAFVLTASVLGLVFLVLLAQAWNLEVNQGAAFAAQSERNSLKQEVLFAERGVVVDDNGVPLITNVESDTGTTERVYKTPGYSGLLGYVSYPKKDSSGNYYSTETSGVAGIEAYYNDLLAGTNGTLLVEEDALGRVQSQATVIPPKNGTSLALSIDTRVQDIFYNTISSLADKIPFSGGVGILMDVNTGEVRAMVSYPEYNSNVLSSGGPSSVIASYNSDPRRPYLNRAIHGLYTPGSVVKPIEASGALTDGTISPDYTINDTGSISVPNPYDPSHPNIFIDWKAIGVEDLRKAIAFSSDVYFYIVGGGYGSKKGLGIDRLSYWFQTYGLTSKTGIDLLGETSGFVPSPAWKEKTFNEAWNIGDTYHTAIGQYSMQVTPIEMARAIAAVANGGTLVTPTLLKQAASRTPSAPPEGTHLPISASALQVVREGMREGVLEGTSVGLSAYESFVHLAGKTGTAQTGVHNEYYNSWAVGFFPYEHPKYVYVVMMEHGPAGNALGGVYVMSQVIAALRQAAPEYFE